MWTPFPSPNRNHSKRLRGPLRASRPVLEALEGRAVMSASFDSVLTVGSDTASLTVPADSAVDGAGNTYVTGILQTPMDFVFSLIKGVTMSTFVVLVGIYYGYHAGDGPVGVGKATARSMIANIVGIHLIGLLGTQAFWGQNPRSPIGG